MIEYIENNLYGSMIYFQNGQKQFHNRAIYIIDQLCQKRLFTYEGYKKALRNTLNMKNNLPIYIDEDHIFIPSGDTKKYETIFFNIVSVVKCEFKDKKIMLFFKSGRILNIDLNIKTFEMYKKKILDIKNAHLKTLSSLTL